MECHWLNEGFKGNISVQYDNTSKKTSYFCSKMSNGTCNVRKTDI